MSLPSPILSKAVSRPCLPAQTVQKCCRLLLQRLSSTYQYNYMEFSLEANDYIDVLNSHRHQVVFAWEKHIGYLVVVTRVGSEYRVVKTGLHRGLDTNYYTKNIWAEYMLVLESQPLWRLLQDMSLSILGEDLNAVARTLLRTPVILQEIWERACHPEAVERAIQRHGGLADYIRDPSADSPFCMLRPTA
jgi:hypothetical protein